MNARTQNLKRLGLATLFTAALATSTVASAQPPDHHRGPDGDAAGEPGGPGGGGKCQHGGGGPEGRRPPRFEDLDTNGDGKLSADEAADIPPVRDLGFAHFDKNKDGFLSKDELPKPPHRGGHRGPDGPNGREGHRPPSFADLDTNGDGKLSPEEAADIPPVRDEGFDTFDKNHDGYLSEEELPKPPHHPDGDDGDAGPGDGHRPPSFEEADTNGDGKLSPEEAAGIPPVDHMGFDKLDKNHDGFLTKDEIPPPPHFGPQARNGGDDPAPEHAPREYDRPEHRVHQDAQPTER